MGKKSVIIGVATIVVVAVVAAVAVISIHKSNNSSSNDKGTAQVATSAKAVKSLCSTTDYAKTCEDSLAPAAGNTTDLSQLVKVAFNVTMARIGDVIKNTTVLQQAAKDPLTADAYKNCEELLVFSIDELERSFERIGTFELNNLDLYVNDLKTWLSAVITYQETCLDGFDNVTGVEAGEKMKELLKVSGELSRNALAMVDEVSKSLPNYTGTTSRRLLSGDASDLPSWVDAGKRKLLQATNYNNLVPNAVVSRNGPYKTINDAMKAIPPKNKNLFVIKVEAGTYEEYVLFTKEMGPVALIGAGMGQTIIKGNRSYYPSKLQTWTTATMAAEGPSFFMRGVTVENTAGPRGHQAVAFRLKSDESIIYQCEFIGFQDTLYPQALRQLYYDCVIRGTVDFIFGDAEAVFQKCKIIVRKPMDNQACLVTAQSRNYQKQHTGFVIQQCSIEAEPDLLSSKVPVKVYLGRPWKALSRVIIMQTSIDKFIHPLGWSQWESTTLGMDTAVYAEYQNTGPGADINGRITWPAYKKNFGPQDAAKFTANTFINANSWVQPKGIPYIPGL